MLERQLCAEAAVADLLEIGGRGGKGGVCEGVLGVKMVGVRVWGGVGGLVVSRFSLT